MTFDNIAELRQYILNTFTANGTRDITGPEAQDAFIGILDLLTPSLQNDLTARISGNVGGVNNNTLFPAGTTLEEVITAILTQAVPPTYIAPTVALSTTLSPLSYEIGSVVSPLFNYAFTQNDAGVNAGRFLDKNGVQISSTMPHTDTSVSLTGTQLNYQLRATYGQGACKNNSLGIVDCAGRIQPGTVLSNIIAIQSFRKAFYGTPVINLTTSAHVRSALSQSLLNPQQGSTFTINIPAGSLRVAFAYPSSIRDVNSVKYIELSNSEVKGNFTQSIISVEGANAYTAISYKVYIYEPVEAFSQTVNYQVTL